MNENIFRQVQDYMKSKFYSFNESWLKDCVQYCAETHPKLSIEGIQSFAKEQWLLSNLREINNENGTLPKNLAQQKCTTLPGRYILQIEKMYDISTSKYKQLEKIRNINVVNLKATKDKESEPWEPKGKRMYQLFLTDGVQEIQAMEYKPIRFFNETLLPGYKLMIIGPVTCRRGIIMLEEKHISGLGGEIEDLLISNSLENILARYLNLKENPDPYNDTKRKEGSEMSDFKEEFQEYLNDLQELVGNRETNEDVKQDSYLNSSVLTLQSNSNIILEKTSTEHNTDELLTEDELEELMLNDPDIVDEFPPIEYVPNRVNLKKLGQKTSFKVPSEPSVKVTEKRKLSTDNSNISGSFKNAKFQDDSFFFDDKRGELSRSWDNHKEINSDYYKTSEKIEKHTKVQQQTEAPSISEFQDDDLILDDEDLILFDLWDNPKGNNSNFYEPVEKSSAVQLSKLSNNNLGIEKSSNGKSSEPKKPSGPCQNVKSLFEKSSTDAGLEIKKMENNSMGWKIISNEVFLKGMEKPKLIDADADLETKKFGNNNILEKRNSFGTPKPFKPLFPKMRCRNTEKSSNANENMETKKTETEPNKGLRLFSPTASNIFRTDLKLEISENESNTSFEDLNANLDSRMKKLLNEPSQNLRESFKSPAKSTSKIENNPWRSESQNTENVYEEFTIGSKRLAEPILTFSTPPKIPCRLDYEKEQIKSRTKEIPLKICDFICDVIKEPQIHEVIYKTVKAKIKEKGKLSHKCGRWNLDGLISDGTADLNVKFSPEFMDSVIGYNAMDFSLAKKQAKKDPKLGEQIRTNMRNAQNKLEKSDWLVKLELAQNKTPIVVSGAELTEEQQTLFEKRLKILKPQYIYNNF